MVLKAIFIGFYLFSALVMAQEGPIGPVGPSETPSTPPSDTSSQTPPVDLPYKPPVDTPKSSAEPTGSFETTPEPVHREIPYIPSKSPEPLGAPDPGF